MTTKGSEHAKCTGPRSLCTCHPSRRSESCLIEFAGSPSCRRASRGRCKGVTRRRKQPEGRCERTAAGRAGPAASVETRRRRPRGRPGGTAAVRASPAASAETRRRRPRGRPGGTAAVQASPAAPAASRRRVTMRQRTECTRIRRGVDVLWGPMGIQGRPRHPGESSLAIWSCTRSCGASSLGNE